jgi:hypothetical protein
LTVLLLSGLVMVDHDEPFQFSIKVSDDVPVASSPTAMQNEGPAQDNDGGPVVPDAPPVSVAELQLPDRYS